MKMKFIRNKEEERKAKRVKEWITRMNQVMTRKKGDLQKGSSCQSVLEFFIRL